MQALRNAGTNVNISATDFDAIKTGLGKSIDMVLVGPEDPLVKEFMIIFG